jgi:hypothetical protein
MMLIPALVVTPPMILLIGQLDAFYGWEPLRPGQSATVTVQLKSAMLPGDPPPVLTLPNGFIADASPVRAVGTRQVSWRVRPMRAAEATLNIASDGESVGKTIAAGTGILHLSKRRVTSIVDLLSNCAELPFRSSAIDWVEVDYSPARTPWLACFILVSMAAWLLAGRFI